MLLGFLKLAQWSSAALLAHVGHLLKCTLLLRASEPSLGTQRTDVSDKPLILAFAAVKRQRRQCPRTGPSWVTVGTQEQASPLDFRASERPGMLTCCSGGLGPLVFVTWDPRHYNQALWATADPEVP